MGTTGMSTRADGITAALNAMVSRANNGRDYLNRVVWPQYQKAQIQRWETENVSQDNPWMKLKAGSWYEKNKAKKYAGYPGGGTKLMVATGKLSDSATGRDTSGFTKVVTNTGIQISINLGYVPYAKYAAEARPIMDFTDETIEAMRQGLINYVQGRPGWAQDA